MRAENDPDLTDDLLVKRSLDGDRAAFESIVKRYESKLFLFIRYRSGDDQEAEDITQSTFLRAYQNLDKFNSKFRFSTWIYTIALRILIDTSRSRKRREKYELEAGSVKETDQNRNDKINAFDIWEAAGKLKKDQYRILWLKYKENMNVHDISAATGISSVNVRVILYRARNNLRKLFSSTEPASLKYDNKNVKLSGDK